MKMTMIQALRSAMDVMLERDSNVVVFGQDVGYFGGVFRFGPSTQLHQMGFEPDDRVAQRKVRPVIGRAVAGWIVRA